jgi:hypothetical protein
MHEFAENIDRFTVNPSRLSGFGFKKLSLPYTTVSVMIEIKNQTLLLEPGDFSNSRFRKLKIWKVLFGNIFDILFGICETKDEKPMTGFKVSQL